MGTGFESRETSEASLAPGSNPATPACATNGREEPSGPEIRTRGVTARNGAKRRRPGMSPLGSNPATPVSRRVTRNPAARRPDSGTVCYIPEDSEPRLSRRAPPRRAFDHPAPDSVDGGQVSHALGRKSRVVRFVCPGERVGNAATGTPGSGVCGSSPEALPGSVRREAGSRHLVSNWPINVCK